MLFGKTKPPNLAQRLLDLKRLKIPGATYTFNGGKEFIYRVSLSPSSASRVYVCELHLRPGREFPEMIVVSPNLKKLAGNRVLPHIYPYAKAGVKLCLWYPKHREWNFSMSLAETYIPWTLRWLWYFEDWLFSDEWAGGGQHPNQISHRNHIS